MKWLYRGLGAVIALVALSVSGAAAQTGANPSDFNGEIVAAGSSTVAPVTARLFEMFTRMGFRGTTRNDVLGTGAGFEHFCQDLNADLANASRPIRESELAACRANGREPIELVIAIDALAVVVSASNTFVRDLTLEQLAAIYSGSAAAWDELDARYPRAAIFPYAPGTDSGTFDYFVEEVFENDPRDILRAPGIQFSESDTVLVTYIESNANALGFFGYAYYYPERRRLRALNIDGVEPNADTAASGAYPLSRPLYLYTAASVLREKPQVAAFARFYLENVNSQLGLRGSQIGYFPVTDATMANNRAALAGM
jgi:phosphate binding protein